jgi:hypothetical protein
LGHNRGETGIEASFSIEKEAELGYAGKRALKENSYQGYSSRPFAPDDRPTHSQAQVARVLTNHLDGLVELKVIAFWVRDPGKQPFTFWIATVILLFNGANGDSSGLELLQESPQVINAIVHHALSALRTEWLLCWHDGEDGTPPR